MFVGQDAEINADFSLDGLTQTAFKQQCGVRAARVSEQIIGWYSFFWNYAQLLEFSFVSFGKNLIITNQENLQLFSGI